MDFLLHFVIGSPIAQSFSVFYHFLCLSVGRIVYSRRNIQLVIKFSWVLHVFSLIDENHLVNKLCFNVFVFLYGVRIVIRQEIRRFKNMKTIIVLCVTISIYYFHSFKYNFRATPANTSAKHLPFSNSKL